MFFLALWQFFAISQFLHFGNLGQVQEMVAEYFGGKRLNFSINPDEAIAYGAAIQANVIAGSAEAKACCPDPASALTFASAGCPSTPLSPP